MANNNKIGLVFGALLGGWHVVWSVLVAIGWAQPLLDFIFWAHMLKPIYIVAGFNVTAAITLVIVTSAAGYALGYVGAWLWNKVCASVT